MSYYSDLSADSSSCGSSDEEDDEEIYPHQQGRNATNFYGRPQTQQEQHNETKTNRVILHVDIDCFYCQCEHLDRQLPVSKPLAIGQKHIIVTSNYAARRLGVQKLQLRQDAYKACPSLLIVEGSDLERYRKHGRKVYDALRECVRTTLAQEILPQPRNSSRAGQQLPAVRRGRGMDEMQADLTSLVDALCGSSNNNFSCTGDADSLIHIYGENDKETTTLVEDQTGQTVIHAYDQRQNHSHGSSSNSTVICQQRLLCAAQRLGVIIQQAILEKTGFTITLGISTNPLLAKLASDLKKPKSINVLYPWRATSLVASMPLRKIPDAGRKTIQRLQPALQQFHAQTETKESFWACGDLLKLPRAQVMQCLESEEQCDMLLERCQGNDSTNIEDDEGVAPKTVSVENSFQRGTVVTPEAVWKVLEDLYVRLPRLLKDRREWSQLPQKAFPTTLRLTARVVDPSLLKDSTRRRRPFVTRSKQIPFRGQDLLEDTNPLSQKAMIYKAVFPLVQSLVLNAANPGDLNVTRLNIAVTNFQDVTTTSTAASTASSLLKRSLQTTPSATERASMKPKYQQPSPTPSNTSSLLNRSVPTTPSSIERSATSNTSGLPKRSILVQTTLSGTERASKKPKYQQQSSMPSSSMQRKKSSVDYGTLPAGIDPATLAELPPEMVKEVLRDYNNVLRTNSSPKPKQPKRIDHYFRPK